jgi:hypothetical protein
MGGEGRRLLTPGSPWFTEGAAPTAAGELVRGGLGQLSIWAISASYWYAPMAVGHRLRLSWISLIATIQ